MSGFTRIAVTGATGFLGRYFLEELAKTSNVDVRALTRTESSASRFTASNLTWFPGSLEDTRCLREFLPKDGCLVHLAYPLEWDAERHVAAIESLARTAVQAGVRRVLHCSTAVVVGNATDAHVDEDTPCEPATVYQRTKLLIEHAWQNALAGRAELVVLRPSAILGIGGKNLLKLSGELTRGSRYANYARSCVMGRRSMNLVCVENVAAALSVLLQREQASARETYFVSDDDEPGNTFRDVEQSLMQYLGVRDYAVPVVPIPQVLLTAALKLRGRGGGNPLRVYDSSRLSRAGYRKVLPLATGLARFAEWYRETARHTR